MTDIYTLDFESFWSKDFSLSKYSVEQYVNDPRFETIGVGVKKNNEETVTFSGSKKATREWLESFNMEEGYVCGHNMVFDYTILKWVFGIRPKLLIDTLSMARAVHGTEVGGSLKALAEHYGTG